MRKIALAGAAALIAAVGMTSAANAAWRGGFYGPHFWGPRMGIGLGFYSPLWVPPPVYYAPRVIVQRPYIAPPPAAYPPPADGATNGNYWYYCNNPQGYYPYVRMCNGQWQTAPANPDVR